MNMRDQYLHLLCALQRKIDVAAWYLTVRACGPGPLKSLVTHSSFTLVAREISSLLVNATSGWDFQENKAQPTPL